MVRLVAYDLRAAFFKEQTLNPNKTACRFDFLAIVDNSGSMTLVNQHLCEMLVVLIETLRKVECRFAIGRFGDRKSQRLLKEFSQPFNLALGEQILESFDFREGSFAHTGFATLANTVWPRKLKDAEKHNTRRVAIMVTDGFSRQNNPAHFQQTEKDHDCQLLIINIRHDKLRDDSSREAQAMSTAYKDRLQVVATHQMENMDPKKGMSLLPDVLGRMLKKAIEEALTLQEETKEELRPAAVVVRPRNALQVLCNPSHAVVRVAEVVGSLSLEALEKQKGSTDLLNQMIMTSGLSGQIPFMTEAEKLLAASGNSEDEQRRELLDEARTQMTDVLTHLRNEHSELAKAAIQSWRRAQERAADQINDLVMVFEDLVFPRNKWTRRRASAKGSSLYLPGLIKAISTNWQYKKFMAQKKAGGKRVYSAVIALDVSLSMSGHLENCAMETLVCLISALRRLSIDSFSVIIFGEAVTVIKSSQEEWDAASILMLFNELSSVPDQYATNDAIAVHAGLDILEQGPPGPKKMFVITDGFSTSGVLLSEALLRAELRDIDVVALATGLDRFAVDKTYKLWIKVGMPSLLADGFRELHKTQGQQLAPVAAANTLEWDHFVPSAGGAESKLTPDEIWTKRKKVFRDLCDALKNEREFTLVNGSGATSFQVDVAIILDCTYSMAPYMGTVTTQLKAIIKTIRQKVMEEYPALKLQLRFAVVPYRDHGDPQIDVIDFPAKDALFSGSDEKDKKWHDDHVTDVCKKIDERIHPKGGGDIPEDVMQALWDASQLPADNQVRRPDARTLSWSPKSKGMFALLICDAPGHGKELCPNELKDNHGPGPFSAAKVMKRFVDNKIELLFCTLHDKNTRLMEDKFRTEYLKHKEGASFDDFKVISFFEEKGGVEQTASHKGFHYVLALDESGSMTGQPWKDLMSAYKTFLMTRASSQGQEDKVTVVKHASYSKVVIQARSVEWCLDNIGVVTFESGGNHFGRCVQVCAQELRKEPGYAPVFVFMSDGHADNPKDAVAALARELKPRGFVMHTLGFGHGVNRQLMEDMATAGGYPKNFQQANTGVELHRSFQNVATSGKKLDKQLVAAFGSQIASAVANKMMAEFL